jgi:hypothetical protein
LGDGLGIREALEFSTDVMATLRKLATNRQLSRDARSAPKDDATAFSHFDETQSAPAAA